MRHLLSAAVVLATFAVTAAEADAQYPPAYGPWRTTGYYHPYPVRPGYAVPYVYAAPRYVRPPNPTGYVNRPYYGAYGYGNYSNGSTDGFPPFRGRKYR